MDLFVCWLISDLGVAQFHSVSVECRDPGLRGDPFLSIPNLFEVLGLGFALGPSFSISFWLSISLGLCFRLSIALNFTVNLG